MEILLSEKELPDILNAKHNILGMTKAYMSAQYQIKTGLDNEGYDSFQVLLLASTFANGMLDPTFQFKKVLVDIDTRLQHICYSGTYIDRDCSVSWDDDNLVMRLKPTH